VCRLACRTPRSHRNDIFLVVSVYRGFSPLSHLRKATSVKTKKEKKKAVSLSSDLRGGA
jgi:hypothetical protein